MRSEPLAIMGFRVELTMAKLRGMCVRKNISGLNTPSAMRFSMQQDQEYRSMGVGSMFHGFLAWIAPEQLCKSESSN